VNQKIRVLFLPRWYPHQYDPMPGLFIQRQAESITPFCDVAVIYVHPDPECPNRYEVVFSEENQVRVIRVYFKPVVCAIGFVGKALNLLKFYHAHQKAFKSIRQFSPQIIHSHLLTRMAFIGWRLSKKNNIPHVISEHWSRYFSENGTYQMGLHHVLTRYLIKKSDALIVVSEPLKTAMQALHLDHPNLQIIHNVVDTKMVLHNPPMNPASYITLIHVSCFEDKSKNISGLLRVLHALSEKRQNFSCELIGTGPDFDDLQAYAKDLGLLGQFVTFTGMKTGQELLDQFEHADFMVLSSHYETFGSVIVEALAMGIPVVTTQVGIAPEVINETNGIMVPPGDELLLEDAVNTMINNCRNYNSKTIRNSVVGKFDPEFIGEKIVAIYKSLLSI